MKYIPYVWQIDLSYKCNASCIHCRNADLTHNLKEISTREWQMLLKPIFEVLGGRLQWITIGGGEPLLAANRLVLFVKWLRQYVSNVMVMTNGSLLSSTLARSLVNAGLRRMLISIEAGNSVDHERVRGAGSFKKAIDAIRICRENNISVTVNTTLISQTPATLYALAKILSQEKVAQWNVREIITIGSASNFVYSYSPEQTVQIYRVAKEIAKEFKLRIFSEDPLFQRCLSSGNTDRNIDNYKGCHAGISYIYCAPDGALHPCSMLSGILLGNLQNGNFWEIWENHPVMNLFRKRYYTGCRSCKFRACCGGCRAIVQATRKNICDIEPRCKTAAKMEGKYA